jgi:hypothetical protein
MAPLAEGVDIRQLRDKNREYLDGASKIGEDMSAPAQGFLGLARPRELYARLIS